MKGAILAPYFWVDIDMKDFIPFLLAHWPLTLAFVLSIIWVVVSESRAQAGGAHGVTPAMLTKMLNSGAMVLDIRSQADFEQGHIVNAKQTDQADLLAGDKKVTRFKKKPVVLISQDGREANKIVAKLKQQGFEQIHVLSGGIVAWKEASMPLVKS